METKSSASVGTNTNSSTLWRGRPKKEKNRQRTAYSELEIVRSFNQAEFKKKQIELLAELNACSKEMIKEILIKHGCEMPEVYNNGKVKKKEGKQVETEKKEEAVVKEKKEKKIVMPESVKAILNGRVEELNILEEKLKEQRRRVNENIDKVTTETVEILEFMDGLEEEDEQGTVERKTDERS